MMAVPAKRGLLTVSTADGSQLTVRLSGDEFYHQYFTEDGYPLQEKEGNFYYCDYDANGDLIESGIKAGEASARGLAARQFLAKVDKTGLEQRIVKRAERVPSRITRNAAATPMRAPRQRTAGEAGPPYEKGYGLFPASRGSQFPSYGDQKAIVILVEYTDVKFNTNYQGGVTAHDYFSRMLNETGFSDYGATGCAAEFYRFNSNDAFRPVFDVYGPVTLSHNQAYYGGNDWYGNDQRPEQMVIEACNLLDDEIDFSEYDRDGDGYVDNIFIFYAGRGEASGGSANTVWPHAWNLASAGYSNEVHDGVIVDRYGCSNEWEGSRPDGVGTFVHEFSHVMGLPDLYATSYTDSFTPGSWSCMDYGPYNNDGMTPPNYGAFERYALGWLKPREIDRAISGTLEPVSENVCGIIRSSKDTEFFLVENRQQEGWDAYIPGHGMLIWHVDYNESIWNSNKVNNTPGHQYVDIEEADGTQSEYSRNGDSFPGATGKTSFTQSTKPAMKTWGNVGLDFPITDIAEADGLITFNVLGGSSETVDAMQINDPTEVSAEGFTLNWEAPAEGYDVIISVYTLKSEQAGEENGMAKAEAEGDRVYLPGFNNKNLGSVSSVTIEDVDPATVYHYTLRQSSGWVTSEPVEGEVFTGKMTIEYFSVHANEAVNVLENEFTASWEPLEGASSYQISVFRKVPGDPFVDETGFDNGLELPKGWLTTCGNTYSMEAYAGKAIPSLRMANGNTLVSPVYSDGVKSVSFWSRGNNTSTGDLINVYAITADGQNLVETVEVNKEKGGMTTNITTLPDGTRQIVIEFKRIGTAGALALDDVVIAHGQDYTGEPLADYQNLEVGDVLSRKVDGLLPKTEYYYTVRATDGTLFSKVSNKVHVKTQDPSGIDQVQASAFAVNVVGLTVSASTADEILVADYTGALVARGSRKVTLPRAGLYIVSVPARNFVKKIVIK